MKQIPCLIIAVGINFFICTIGVCVEPFEEQRGHEKIERVRADIFNEIGLTVEQKAQIEKMKETEKNAFDLKKDIVRTKMFEMKQELDKYEADQKKIEQIINELTDIHKEKMVQRVEKIQKIKKILTKEQFETLVKKMDEKRLKEKEIRRKFYEGQESVRKKEKRATAKNTQNK
jgi:Spy/CpxP family protein refolding chaperone